MKQFRKIIAFLTACVLAAAMFAGCQTELPTGPGVGIEGPHGVRFAEDQTLRTLYHVEATTLNWLSTADSAINWRAVSQAQQGLVTTDMFDFTVPGLAYAWTICDDGLVYTFNLRQGLPWVDYQFNIIGYLTAHDFVASALWTLTPENMSSNTNIYINHINNAAAFFAGDITDFDQVGWRALDDYTLEITLVAPRPFFLDMLGSFTVAYRGSLEEHGRFFGTDNTRLSFIGPYVITVFEPGFRRIYERNPFYHNAEEVFIERVIATFNSDAGILAPEMFLRGETDFTSIDVTVLDRWMNDDNLRDIVIPGLPSFVFMYYYIFNFDPNFHEDYEPGNWDLAVNNENFRQSIYWAFDPLMAIQVRDPFNGEMLLVNTITPPTFAVVDGKCFTQFYPIREITERPNWQFEPERARMHRDLAIEELTAQGATFPIIVLMVYDPSDFAMVLEKQVLSQHLVNILGEDFIQPVLRTGPGTNFLSIRRQGEYALLRSRNGPVAPNDPASWSFPFERGNNWNFPDLATGEETQRIVEEYYRLLDIAHSITTRSYERYSAFAHAEAHFLNHAMVIPFSTETEGYYASRTILLHGSGSYPRWRGQKVLEEPLTIDQFRLLYADWLVAREAALQALGN